MVEGMLQKRGWEQGQGGKKVGWAERRAAARVKIGWLGLGECSAGVRAVQRRCEADANNGVKTRRIRNVIAV
jgi:hypothetical protein